LSYRKTVKIIRFIFYGMVLTTIIIYNQVIQFLGSFGLSEGHSNLVILIGIVWFSWSETKLAQKIASKIS